MVATIRMVVFCIKEKDCTDSSKGFKAAILMTKGRTGYPKAVSHTNLDKRGFIN